jgi:uncharacterized protein YkwD
VGILDTLLGWWRRRRPPPPDQPVPGGGGEAGALLAAHNAARAARGLPPLRLDPRLCAAAGRGAGLCAATGRLDHFAGGTTPWTRIAEAGYRYAGASENLALGQRTAAEAVASWLADPPHAANVLGPWAEAGFARAGDVWAADYATPAR